MPGLTYDLPFTLPSADGYAGSPPGTVPDPVVVPVPVSQTFYANLIDGANILVLRGDSWQLNPFFLKELDLGFPAVREVVSDSAGRDGVDDYTTRFGARTVTMHLYVRAGNVAGASINTNLDTLRAFCAPNRRVYLEVMRPGWAAPRRMLLRANQFSCVINKTSHIYAEAQLSFSAPTGVMESAAPVTTTISPLLGAAGFAFTPGTAPAEAFSFTPGTPPGVAFSFTPGTGQNIQAVVNPGSVEVAGVFVVQGPCDDPQIILAPGVGYAGARIGFAGLSVGATPLVVDVAAHTAKIGTTSVYSRINWTLSRWFTIPSGTSSMQFDAKNAGIGCLLQISFSPRYL